LDRKSHEVPICANKSQTLRVVELPYSRVVDEVHLRCSSVECLIDPALEPCFRCRVFVPTCVSYFSGDVVVHPGWQVPSSVVGCRGECDCHESAPAVLLVVAERRGHFPINVPSGPRALTDEDDRHCRVGEVLLLDLVHNVSSVFAVEEIILIRHAEDQRNESVLEAFDELPHFHFVRMVKRHETLVPGPLLLFGQRFEQQVLPLVDPSL